MGRWIMMDRKHVMVQWFMVMSLVPLNFVRQSVLSVRFGLTARKMYFFVSLVPIINSPTPDAPHCSGIGRDTVVFGLDKSVIHRIVSLKAELIFIVFRFPGVGTSGLLIHRRRNGRLGNQPRNYGGIGAEFISIFARDGSPIEINVLGIINERINTVNDFENGQQRNWSKEESLEYPSIKSILMNSSVASPRQINWISV